MDLDRGGIGKRYSHTGADFREAEIEQLRPGLRKDDVPRLQVAVNDAAPMRLVEGICDPDRATESQIDRERAARQSRGQRLSLEYSITMKSVPSWCPIRTTCRCEGG